MRHALFVSALLATPAVAAAQPAPPIATITETLSGQPISAPAGRLTVTISETRLAPGGTLPVHKHPYARIVQVLEGRLRVANLDTGQAREVAAGDWLVDAIDQWHEAAVVGDAPVRLLVIDQAPPGAAVTVLRAP
jgi:quercetin dioxygenase-like cupin family protein